MPKIAIPSTSVELEDLLNDRSKVQNLMEEGQFTEFIAEYARVVVNKDASLAQQVREQTQAELAKMLKTDPKSTPPVDFNPITGASFKYAPVMNKRAPGYGLNGKFEDLAEFALMVDSHRKRDNKFADKALAVQNYQEKYGAEGGFLVPEEFRAEILRNSLESAIVRPRARIIPMGTPSIEFPSIDETTHNGSVFGGVTCYWQGEGAELTEAEGKFGSVKLDVQDLTALAHVTNNLLNDSAGAFGAVLSQIMPEAIAWYEDLGLLKGNGVGKPMGALSAANTAIITVTKQANQAADTIVYENALKMYTRMLPSSLARAVWLVTQDAFMELATMALSVGTGGGAVWLTGAQGRPVLTLFGCPVIMTEKAPGVLGDQGDISFVDFGMYLIGDRQQMTMESSVHVKWTSNKTSFKAIQRLDGRPWMQSPITPENGGPTLSPFVQLEARA